MAVARRTATVGGTMDLPAKLDVARALLLNGSVFIHLDPRVEGVVVPKWLSRQPQLVLQIGLDMAIPIPDLRVDENGVYGTLSFNRSPFTCLVPWDAVFALAGEDGRGMVWPESMPPEITAEIEREAGRRAPAPPSPEVESEDAEGDEEPVPQVIPLRPAHRPTAELARRPEPAPPAATPPVHEGGPQSGKPSTGKGGRHLPPYLRVIK